MVSITIDSLVRVVVLILAEVVTGGIDLSSDVVTIVAEGL